MKNIPLIEIDPFTKEKHLEWENVGGNNFYEKILNGSINMVSKKPDINRLFLTINHIANKDVLILRHPSKDYMLDLGDKFFILFENNDVIEFEIEKKSFLIYSSYGSIYKQVFENRITLFEEDLIKLKNSLIKDWRIQISGNRKIENMSHFGGEMHNYHNIELLQTALKSMFADYFEIVTKFENYKPLKRIELTNIKLSEETCYLYLMKDLANGYYKIGISSNPSYREKTLQSEKPTIELIISKEFPNRKIATSFESALHKSYQHKRLRGEWFELNIIEIEEIKFVLK